jgi:hypothetical protein
MVTESDAKETGFGKREVDIGGAECIAVPHRELGGIVRWDFRGHREFHRVGAAPRSPDPNSSANISLD